MQRTTWTTVCLLGFLATAGPQMVGCGGGGGGGSEIQLTLGWETLYQTDFEDGTGQGGWTLLGGLWSFRTTPLGWPDRGTGLYYSDGVDYDDGTANSGFATSPHFSFAQHDGATLSFECVYDIDPAESVPDADRREVWIQIPGGGDAGTYKILLKRPGAADPTGVYDQVVTCMSGHDLWHSHSIDFSPAWQKFGYFSDVTLTLQARFLFTTVDAAFNQGKGWGIDHLTVTAMRIDLN